MTVRCSDLPRLAAVLFFNQLSKVPFCLPERLLTQLHNDGMAKRAQKQVDRLRSLYPDLMQTMLSHPKTAMYASGKAVAGRGAGEATSSQAGIDTAPLALVWAFAMVRSRAFASEDDRFAFVPFLVSTREHSAAAVVVCWCNLRVVCRPRCVGQRKQRACLACGVMMAEHDVPPCAFVAWAIFMTSECFLSDITICHLSKHNYTNIQV